jgi:hypothetical protein
MWGKLGGLFGEGFLERGNAMFLVNKALTLSRNGEILLLQFHQIQKMLKRDF